MKRKIVFIISVSLLFSGVILLLNKKDNKDFIQNRVTYALTVDGKKQNSFPNKGMYRVDTECSNATCKWDYENWKLNVENISGEVTCDISFNSTEKNYLYDHIINHKGQTSGTGSIKLELETIPDYENVTILNEADYLTSAQFSTTTSTATSGTAVDGLFTFSDNMWQSNPDKMGKGYYYKFSFKVPSAGYYQICYELQPGNDGNYLDIYTGSTRIVDVAMATTETKKECKPLGKFASNQSLIVSEQIRFSENSMIKFNVQKVANKSKVNGIRYEGKNPNNYVLFNNELWRIIGVFDGEDLGIENNALVKIIRATSIGSLPRQNSYWINSYLNQLLNSSYYNKEEGSESTYCQNKPACDFRNMGLNTKAQNMAASVKWYLGGISSVRLTTEEIYRIEKGMNSGSDKPTSKFFEGKIGLMYASDYGYSARSGNCSRTTELGSYSYFSTPCAADSWLYYGASEWVLTAFSSPGTTTSYDYAIDGQGKLSTYNRDSNAVVRPALYLNQNVYILDGDGSMTDPYIIDM